MRNIIIILSVVLFNYEACSSKYIIKDEGEYYKVYNSQNDELVSIFNKKYFCKLGDKKSQNAQQFTVIDEELFVLSLFSNLENSIEIADINLEKGNINEALILYEQGYDAISDPALKEIVTYKIAKIYNIKFREMLQGKFSGFSCNKIYEYYYKIIELLENIVVKSKKYYDKAIYIESKKMLIDSYITFKDSLSLFPIWNPRIEKLLLEIINNEYRDIDQYSESKLNAKMKLAILYLNTNNLQLRDKGYKLLEEVIESNNISYQKFALKTYRNYKFMDNHPQ